MSRRQTRRMNAVSRISPTIILQRGLQSLDKLDTAKEAERLTKSKTLTPINESSPPINYSKVGSYKLINLTIIEGLSSNFNPSDLIQSLLLSSLFNFPLLFLSLSKETPRGRPLYSVSSLQALRYYFVLYSPFI